MKTLVSVTTGRKDYPVFNHMSNGEILDYLKREEWYFEGCEIFLDGDIIEVNGEDFYDTFQIVDVEIVDYRDV